MSDYRNLPKIDQLAAHQDLAGHSEHVRIEAARAAVAELRTRIASGQTVDLSEAPKLASEAAKRLNRPSLRRAINLSGVVLHTGLGRARLAPEAERHIAEVAAGHAAVEYDLESGRRGDRQVHVRESLRRLTGAEDAFVVNNAAAGVLLSLSALASGQDVVLSRGQMVEIGGSFRMPDVVRQSGCRLVEVGCTNKTRLNDYAEAMTSEHGVLLRCHPSNYKVIGFAEEVPPEKLSSLAHERGWRMVDDVGSGCLLDSTTFGLPKEQTLQEAVAAGADVVIASGDKLLGGPQAGLILGTREAIEAIRRHPLARAVRVDKLTLAGLEATLRLYVQGRHLEIPTWRYLARTLDDLKPLAEALMEAAGAFGTLEEGVSEVGGGSAPGSTLPTWRVGLSTANPEATLAALRHCGTPVVARIEDGRVWLDPRTLDENEVADAQEALREALSVEAPR